MGEPVLSGEDGVHSGRAQEHLEGEAGGWAVNDVGQLNGLQYVISKFMLHIGEQMANLDKKPILRLRTKPGKSKKNEDALLLNIGGRLSYDLYVTLLLLILLHCLCCLTSIKGDQ